jgi:hypothetical protein
MTDRTEAEQQFSELLDYIEEATMAIANALDKHEVWPRFTCDNHTTNTELQPDTVRISRECALEALHAMQNDQARPDFQCGELNEAIGQLKQALEKGE